MAADEAVPTAEELAELDTAAAATAKEFDDTFADSQRLVAEQAQCQLQLNELQPGAHEQRKALKLELEKINEKIAVTAQRTQRARHATQEAARAKWFAAGQVQAAAAARAREEENARRLEEEAERQTKAAGLEVTLGQVARARAVWTTAVGRLLDVTTQLARPRVGGLPGDGPLVLDATEEARIKSAQADVDAARREYEDLRDRYAAQERKKEIDAAQKVADSNNRIASQQRWIALAIALFALVQAAVAVMRTLGGNHAP